MRIKKNILLVALLVMTLFTGGCSSKVVVQLGLPDSSVFTINSFNCTNKEAKLYFITLRNEYKDYYGIDIWSEAVDASGDASAGKSNLSDYVSDKTMARLQNVCCMYLLAEERGITLSDKEEGYLTQAANQFYESLTSEERKELKVSVDDIATYYRHFLMANKLYEELTGGVEMQVSDGDARVMKAQIIYTTDETIAAKVESALNSGNEFAAVAAIYSEYDSIAVNIKKGDFSEEIEEAAFALSEEETTDCIEADGGYYFIKCISRIDEELTEENRQAIIAETTEATFDSVYEEYVKALYIQVDEDMWEKVTGADYDELTTKDFFNVYNEWF
ncbi:MAG: peptidyl-prolyl cis-trans isomerase [Eubacterium sp.]|nr:peptidyl-prolyl cis-trans isomerase [Eubacterium sp.]